MAVFPGLVKLQEAFLGIRGNNFREADLKYMLHLYTYLHVLTGFTSLDGSLILGADTSPLHLVNPVVPDLEYRTCSV